MNDDKQQLETLKKKVATFLDMQKIAPSRKGDWQFTVKKKELEDEIRQLIAPPPPPKQATLEGLGI